MKKVLSCLLSFLPLILTMVPLVIMMILVAIYGDKQLHGAEAVLAFSLLGAVVIGVILTFVLMVWYMIKTWKDFYLSTGMKILWTALLYCCNIFVFPVYWFVCIRHEYDSY